MIAKALSGANAEPRSLNKQTLALTAKGTFAPVNSGTASSSNYNVLATAFAKNDIASSLNNGTVVTDTSCHIPNNTKTFYLGWYTTGNGLSAHVKRFTFWPERLSNDTLKEITKE